MMKNSIKILILAGILTGSYDYAMDLKDDNRLGNVPGNQIDQQPAMSKQQVLNKVNYQLKLLQRQAATIQDPLVAKELVAQTLAKIAALTGDASLQDLYSVVDQAIDISDQDIKEQSSGQVVIQAFQDGPSFGQAFSIIARGLAGTLKAALGASLGLAAGGLVSAGIALGTPANILSSVYNAAKAPAPYGAINPGDGIGTVAAKLLPNILSRALNVVLSPTACVATAAIGIVAIPIVGGVYGGVVANMKTHEIESLNKKISKFRKNQKTRLDMQSDDLSRSNSSRSDLLMRQPNPQSTRNLNSIPRSPLGKPIV